MRFAAAVLLLVIAGPGAAATPLRVCADPNNLPFSNAAREGFENALAELVADDLGRSVEYTWWAQRRGFMRSTLNAGLCDVVMGVPSDVEMALTTRPYYRSTYAFVTRPGSGLHLTSFDDRRLRTLRIGVHVIGDDYAPVPPAQALADRGIVQNVRGFSIYGDYGKPNPPAELIDAVRRGVVDVAIAWGPLAGYFAATTKPPLEVRPVRSPAAMKVPLSYSISMAVRRGDTALGKALDEVIVRRRTAIRDLLRKFHVPIIEGERSPT